jgi:hypothetical protein
MTRVRKTPDFGANPDSRRSQATWIASLALSCVLLSGCGGHSEYVIEMEPEGGRLKRKLSVVQHSPNTTVTSDDGGTGTVVTSAPATEGDPEELPEDVRSDLDRIAKLYGVPATQADSGGFVFEQRFSGELPNDVGGAGSYLFYSNSLGSASVYVERFRGNDDPAGQLQKQARAIDLVVDHTIAWSKQEPELGAKPGYEKLRVFLDKKLRQDLKNLGLYALRGGVLSVNSSKENQIEFGFRAALFLVERGYIETVQIPEIMRRFSEDDETAGLRVAQRLFASKLEIDPKELSIFEDPEVLEKSVNAYLRSTREYRELVREWETARKDDAELQKPEPGDVIGVAIEPLGESIQWFQIEDTITLSLRLSAEPLYSNGEWDGEKLNWKRKLESAEGDSAPVISFATWVTPNDAFQRRLFGEVIVDGEMLLEACLGIAGMAPDERRDLEEGLDKLPLVAELKPQFEALRAQLKAEVALRGGAFDEDEYSSRAWELIRSKLPEPIGDAK